MTVQALDSQGALIQAGVSPQIDAGVSPQADAGVSPQADAGVSAQADAGVSPQADAGVSSSGFRLSQTQVDLVVTDDGPTVPFAVTFRPLPACMDGVDNDGDGRVDLDDPDCADDPYGKHE